jgi:hypothetical protein
MVRMKGRNEIEASPETTADSLIIQRSAAMGSWPFV